jgi:hypothetical protein|tara:strand:- start:349 stop:567 length:219 start_codon:yes stop_codon:yes gene_type:complete
MPFKKKVVDESEERVEAAESVVDFAVVCNRYKELRIGKEIKFENGLFKTTDPKVIAKLKANDGWLVFIHPRD